LLCSNKALSKDSNPGMFGKYTDKDNNKNNKKNRGQENK
jgi:hypothetical protein